MYRTKEPTKAQNGVVELKNIELPYDESSTAFDAAKKLVDTLPNIVGSLTLPQSDKSGNGTK